MQCSAGVELARTLCKAELEEVHKTDYIIQKGHINVSDLQCNIPA